jgi:two-component system, OmpR family, response regulator
MTNTASYTFSVSPDGAPHSTAASMRVLVIEDDAEVARYLLKGLKESGYIADHAATGTDGLVMAMGESYDAIVIDRMLPGLDGLVLIETLRKSANRTPVLILSALGEVDQRVQGLRAGGDDYLTKPFAFTELLARLEALLRRGGGGRGETVLRVGDLEMDLLAHTVRRAGQSIDLQPREFRLLEYLMRHAGHVVTRTMLLEGVWDYHFDPQTNVIDVHISRLRQKIDKGFDKPLIHTIRGAGYSLRPAKADAPKAS